MSDQRDGGIAWTDETWNVLRGCSRVSAGCMRCYAERQATRFSGPGMPYEGLIRDGKWNGTVRLVEDKLTEPLRWRKPRRVFVNSMSDLFHENVCVETIDRIFAVMALAPQHTFQILTKRPERMRHYISTGFAPTVAIKGWPLPNVWLGVSVEDQATADARIPLLLHMPAAVRFISAEPLLGAIDLKNIASAHDEMMLPLAGLTWSIKVPATLVRRHPQLDWVICGGESGPGARPCNVSWIRAIVRQCTEAGVACFVKQLGAHVIDRNDAGFMGDEPDHWPEEIAFRDAVEHDLDGTRDGYQGAPVRIHLKARKGDDPAEWPEDLRAQEFPAVSA